MSTKQEPQVSTFGRTDLPDLHSPVATARMMRCSTKTVYRLVAAGELTPIRIGRAIRFELSEIHRYLDRHRGGGHLI